MQKSEKRLVHFIIAAAMSLLVLTLPHMQVKAEELTEETAVTEAATEIEEEAAAEAVAPAEEEMKEEVAEQVPMAASPEDIQLLAALIQCEAGSQPYEGQVAVGEIVMNRVESGRYPNTIQGVIFANGQFPPATNGLVASKIQKGIKASCLQAAQQALAGSKLIGDATHFRRAGSREGVVIGAHVFW